MVRKVVIIDDEPWTRGVVMKLAQWNRLGLELQTVKQAWN